MELFTRGLNLDDKIFNKSELTAAAGQADVPVPTATDRIDAEVRLGPRGLKLIAPFATGVGVSISQWRSCTSSSLPTRRGFLTESTAVMTKASVPAVSPSMAKG